MLKFSTEKDLERFLRRSELGKKLMSNIESSDLVAVQHHDRVDLYGEGLKLHVFTCPHAESNEAGLLCEELVELAMPPQCASLYWPSSLLGTVTNTCYRVHEYAKDLESARLLCGILGIADRNLLRELM
jgi:hypothetical protein